MESYSFTFSVIRDRQLIQFADRRDITSSTDWSSLTNQQTTRSTACLAVGRAVQGALPGSGPLGDLHVRQGDPVAVEVVL